MATARPTQQAKMAPLRLRPVAFQTAARTRRPPSREAGQEVEQADEEVGEGEGFEEEERDAGEGEGGVGEEAESGEDEVGEGSGEGDENSRPGWGLRVRWRFRRRGRAV